MEAEAGSGQQSIGRWRTTEETKGSNRGAKLGSAVGMPRIAGEVGVFQRFCGGNRHDDDFFDNKAFVTRRDLGQQLGGAPE